MARAPVSAHRPVSLARWRLVDRIVLALVTFGAVILYAPALRFGPLADDLFQLAYVDGLFGPKSPFGLYFFALDDPAATAIHTAKGSLPWWTVPHFRFAHLRPLSSLFVYVDAKYLPRDSIWPHVHSFAWMAAMLYGAWRVLAGSVGRRIAVVALVAVAIDEPLAWTASWLANRCALISAVFGYAALLVHARWRLRGRAGRLVAIELLLWVAAFAAGEYAISVLALSLVWELLYTRDGWRARIVAMLPAGVIAVAFAIAYVAIGCGVYGATTYVDPLTDTGTFVYELANRLLRMASEVFIGLPGETERLWLRYGWTGIPPAVFRGIEFDPPARSWRHAWLAGIVTVLVVTFLWRACRSYLTPRERRGVAWLVWGSLLGLLPLAAIPPATRAIGIPSLGGATFFAAVVVALCRMWQRRRPGHLLRRLGTSLLVVPLAWEHVVGDALFVRMQLAALADVREAHREFFDSPDVHAIDLRGRHVMVLTTPDLVTGIYGLATMDMLGRPLPESWHALAMDIRRHLVRTLDDHTIELSAIGPFIHVDFQEALFRNPKDALAEGEVIDVGVFRATVLRAPENEGPQAVSFRFRERLDSDELVFLEATKQGLRRFELPPVGQARVIQPPQIPRGPR